MFGLSKKRSEGPTTFDLAQVDSREKAESLWQKGVLGKLFMRPLEFGGDDHPLNIFYVPPAIVKEKSDVDLQVIRALMAQGRVRQYKVEPEYHATSVVPISLKVTVSEPETYCFTMDIWGPAVERQGHAWEEVYAARETFFGQHFGPITGDVQKLMNLTGVWPGGCLVQIEAAAHQLWVSSSFGLTNSDMPARTRSEQFQVKEGAQKYQLQIVARPPRAVPAGRAGYGFEMLLLTRHKEYWPLMFLNWAMQAEILRDADILGRVHHIGAVTIQEISLGDGRVSDFLIAPLQHLAPPKASLPNGTMELLAATAITRPEMQFALERGQAALLDRIRSRPLRQVSHIV
jgi:hypothetical protein